MKQGKAKVRVAFIQIGTAFKGSYLPLKTKIFVLQCPTFPFLFTGTEVERSLKRLKKRLKGLRCGAIDISKESPGSTESPIVKSYLNWERNVKL